MLAGCTGSGGTSTPTTSSTAPSAPAPSSSTAPSTPAGSPTSTSSVLVPGADCLPGTWRLVRFVGLGEQTTYGTGQGGDVRVTFDDGRYNLVGEGKRPITVNLAGESASLTVDGTVAGTYQPDGAEMTFTVEEATGQGILESGKQKQTLPMASISQVIAPQGKATLACPDNLLLIALPTVRLEFER
jgi:hypothetical protein